MAGEKDGRVVLMDALAADPETGPVLQQLVDKIAPGSVATARATEAAERIVTAKLSEIDAVKKDLEAQHRKLATRDLIDSQRRDLLRHPFAQEHGITASDLPEIERLMLEKDSGLGSHLAAARVWVASRIVGAPRTDAADHGIQFPRADMNGYFKGQGEGRGITDGPSPRQMGDQWAKDRAYKDLNDILNHKPLDPSPYDGAMSGDERVLLMGGRR